MEVLGTTRETVLDVNEKQVIAAETDVKINIRSTGGVSPSISTYSLWRCPW